MPVSSWKPVIQWLSIVVCCCIYDLLYACIYYFSGFSLLFYLIHSIWGFLVYRQWACYSFEIPMIHILTHKVNWSIRCYKKITIMQSSVFISLKLKQVTMCLGFWAPYDTRVIITRFWNCFIFVLNTTEVGMWRQTSSMWKIVHLKKGK